MYCKNFNVDAITFNMISMKVNFHLKSIYTDFQHDKDNPALSKEQVEKYYQKYDNAINVLLKRNASEEEV